VVVVHLAADLVYDGAFLTEIEKNKTLVHSF
jgi:hypothetical protein